MTIPMFNVIEVMRTIPSVKIFEMDGMAIAQYNCFPHGEIGVWTHTDYLLHVLSSEVSWRSSSGLHTAHSGETVFFKKGARILPAHSKIDLCVELFFIPDSLIKETVLELAKDLPTFQEPVEQHELSIRINPDTALFAFFHAMTIHFAGNEKPPVALLKLKMKELLISIFLNRTNPGLAAYLRSITASESPSISSIMEMNFNHNLSLDDFAQMCHRSLSSFKREFQKLYGTSPGKWLLERRLQHSASLLQTTDLSITQICLECGFEDISHFSRSFKDKFGHAPSDHRDRLNSSAKSLSFTAKN
jgi:AraC-like DNA-binding protein